MTFNSKDAFLESNTLIALDDDGSSDSVAIIDSSLFWRYLMILTLSLTLFFLILFAFIGLYDFDKDSSNFERRRKIEISK